MQDWLLVFAEKLLPDHTNWNHSRFKFLANGGVGVGDGLLRFWGVLTGPGQIEDGLRASPIDRFVEQSNVFVHSLGVLDRKRALLLEHDIIVVAALDGF